MHTFIPYTKYRSKRKGGMNMMKMFYYGPDSGDIDDLIFGDEEYYPSEK